MPTEKVNGINLYYEIKGKGEPILFISGFSSSHQGWLPYVEHFSQYFQTIIFDNRGAGQSESTSPPYTIQMLAEDVTALLNRLNIQRAHMVGSSMGTAIIQTLSLLYPKTVKKAVLIAPFSKLPQTSLRKSEAIGKLIQAGVPLSLVVEAALPWLFSNDFLAQPELIQSKVSEMTHNPNHQGFQGQLSALKRFDIRNQLHQIQSELLLVAGEEDLSTPLYCAKFLHENIPSTQLHIFPHVGHMVHVEKRDQVIKLVKKFLMDE